MRDEEIVAAARAIRAELPELWVGDGAARAAEVDALLRCAANGQRVGDRILALLTSDSATRRELRRRLPREEDTYRQAPPLGSYSALAGHGDPSKGVVYRCSVCDYSYPLFEVGEPVPEGCPDGHGPLVRVV
ncbi:hypothetical protein ACFOSC_13050 [Streptantibioticus rubrisoli]|uniref:Uncharacterized protein n=1 Tax=Streptantibioticus rubrisoli TaxID=1387313 RepID=A0ABT1P7T8_9ACTN|nr:hypothetical protein [Streptantibioticus rubrisoli]MCQ4041442.1 hypothetical protein [Streptantibioticus rubrisoli]